MNFDTKVLIDVGFGPQEDGETIVLKYDAKRNKFLRVKKAKGRNVFADRKHIALSEITEDNIRDVFAYCNVAGKMRLVRTVPASIDPKALTLEFMAPAEFRNAFVNTGEEHWVEVEVLDKKATQVEGEPPITKKEVRKVKRTIAESFLISPDRMTYDRMVFEADAKKVRATDYNTWTGFTLQPASGDWRLMDRMMFELARERRQGIVPIYPPLGCMGIPESDQARGSVSGVAL